MPTQFKVSEFLVDSGEIIIDARSEGEYHHGHIPGAINIPLLNNEERRIVGTCYKREGREEAVLKGFELVGHKFAEYIRKVSSLASGKKVKVYCWRGGMRSNIMAWVLSLSGFKVSILSGGYKAYRAHVLDTCSKNYKLVILGGPTGSGKTEVLHHLKLNGEQVVDLEGIAKHKGSAFGGLGMDGQPTYEHFENLLARELSACDPVKRIWLENESRLIGSVKIPDILYDNIRKAPVVEINIPFETRVKRLVKEYGDFDRNILADNTKKLTKRLGHQRMTEAVTKVLIGDVEGWIQDVLSYYDKTYAYGKSLRVPSSIKVTELPDDRFEKHLDTIIQAAGVLETHTLVN